MWLSKEKLNDGVRDMMKEMSSAMRRQSQDPEFFITITGILAVLYDSDDFTSETFKRLDFAKHLFALDKYENLYAGFQEYERRIAILDTAVAGGFNGEREDLGTQSLRIYKWFKKKQLMGSCLQECMYTLMDKHPDFVGNLFFRLPPELNDSDNWPTVGKELWVNGLHCALAFYRFCIIEGLLPEGWDSCTETDGMLYIWALTVLFILYSANTQLNRVKIPGLDEISSQYQARLEEKETTIKRISAELEQERVEHRKALSAVVVPLEQSVRDKDAEIERLRNQVKDLEDMVKVREDLSILEESSLENSADFLELPDERVTFAGGHPILRAKIAQKFPKWEIVDTNAIKDDWGDNLIFLYTDHLSHVTFRNVRAQRSSGVLYCHGTNMSILENSMRMSYTQYIKTQEA